MAIKQMLTVVVHKASNGHHCTRYKEVGVASQRGCLPSKTRVYRTIRAKVGGDRSEGIIAIAFYWTMGIEYLKSSFITTSLNVVHFRLFV